MRSAENTAGSINLMLLYHVEKCEWYSYYHLSTMHMTAPYVLKLMTAICLDHVEGRITVIAFAESTIAQF
jgi:hypothetical protein